MKTRTLLLLSVASGLAIMLAGAVFLFQLSSQDDAAAPLAIGAEASVGDMDVRVVDATPGDPGRLVVAVEIGGVDDATPGDEFRMIASGRPAPLESTTCSPTTTTPQNCRVVFDVSGADGTSRVLFYQRGDQQARWVVDAP